MVMKLDKKLLYGCYTLLGIAIINLLLYVPYIAQKLYMLMGYGIMGKVCNTIIYLVPKLGIRLSFLDRIFANPFRLMDGLSMENFGGLVYAPISTLLSLTIIIATMLGVVNYIKTNGAKGLGIIKFCIAYILISSFINSLSNLVHIVTFKKDEYVSTRGGGLLGLFNSFSRTTIIDVLVSFTVSISFLYAAYYFNKLLKKQKQYVDNTLFSNSIFSEIEATPVWSRTASAGQRFANYIIDAIVIACVFERYDSAITLMGMFNSTQLIMLSTLIINYIFYLFYYPLLEALLGYTCGKAITNTSVVDIEGQAIGWGKAFTRTLSRFVPFEPFSAFGGKPWHDEWTNTYVIKNNIAETTQVPTENTLQ